MSRKNIVQGAFILTSASIITRLLGFVYRIYMSNLIGAEGMGLYQLIMPIYGLCWSIACSGFTTSISKLTSQEKARGEHGNVKKILHFSLTMSGGIGFLLSIIIFIFSDFIALKFIGDIRVVPALKIMSICLPFMAIGSCIRGYFFGIQEAKIPAINQVLEQCVRMIVIFALASVFMLENLITACIVAMIGVVAEEIVSFIFIYICYKKHQVNQLKRFLPRKSDLTKIEVANMVLTMAVPLTLHRVTSALLFTFENILIPQRLQLFGLELEEAMSLYGQLTGMAMPLIFFPSALLTSLSISLVPSISSEYTLGRYKNVASTINKTLLFTNVVGIGAGGFFICFAKPLGELIYNQDLTSILICLGAMCPFLYLQTTLSGILNGLGFQVFIFKHSLISSAISMFFIYFIIPHKGIDAFIMGWFISLLVVTVAQLGKIEKSVNLKIGFLNWFVKPTFSAILSYLFIHLIIRNMIEISYNSLLGMIIMVPLFGIIYLFSIVTTGSISIKDITNLLTMIKPGQTQKQKYN